MSATSQQAKQPSGGTDDPAVEGAARAFEQILTARRADLKSTVTPVRRNTGSPPATANADQDQRDKEPR